MVADLLRLLFPLWAWAVHNTDLMLFDPNEIWSGFLIIHFVLLFPLPQLICCRCHLLPLQ